MYKGDKGVEYIRIEVDCKRYYSKVEQGGG